MYIGYYVSSLRKPVLSGRALCTVTYNIFVGIQSYSFTLYFEIMIHVEIVVRSFKIVYSLDRHVRLLSWPGCPACF